MGTNFTTKETNFTTREIKEILSRCDHTLLAQTATLEQIKGLCDDALKFKTASVCIPPCYVTDAVKYLNGQLPVCTVIGFPNGNMTTETKIYETRDAVARGVDEIDVVINVGFLKDKRFGALIDELRAVRRTCNDRILKVIIENCLLTDEEKVLMCSIVAEAGADYIKTSTGFSSGGATREDVKLFAENVPKGLKIKAAGGISSLEDARDFIALGADRLGTSRVVRTVKEQGLLEEESNG